MSQYLVYLFCLVIGVIYGYGIGVERGQWRPPPSAPAARVISLCEVRAVRAARKAGRR